MPSSSNLEATQPSAAAATAAATAMEAINNNNNNPPPPPLQLGDISNNTNSFVPVQPRCCDWRFSISGCKFNLLPTNDTCDEPGCNKVFHHGCQTECEFNQYRRDVGDKEANANPGLCTYDSAGRKKCMAHHKDADVFLQGVPLDEEGFPHTPPSSPNNTATSKTNDSTTTKTNSNNNNNKKNKMSKEEKKQQKKEQFDRQVAWAKTLTIDHIIADEDGTDVNTLGGTEWAPLHGEVKKAFMQKNKITIPHKMRKVGDFGKVVMNHIKAQGYKNNLTAPNRRSRSAATKPTCIVEEGTLFRVINTITECKEDYIETNNAHDQADQDTRNPKALAWERMAAHYNSNADSLEKLSPGGAQALLGHSVAADVCAEYDELTPGEFKECANYVKAWYREKRNHKNQSGRHKPFGDYCQGKKWLLYFHAVLEEVGDKGLASCAYPELSSEVFRASDSGFNPLSRNRRRNTASDRTTMSMSPLTDGGTVRTKKHSAVEATTEAAHAIRNRNEDMHYDHKFDRMMNMKTQATTTNLQVMKLDKSYKKAKRKYEGGTGTKEDYKAIKVQRNTLKKQVKAYQGEYERLKKEVGYESPPSSDSSDSSDEDTDNNKGNGNKEKGNDNEETQQPQEENDDEVNNEGNGNEEEL